MSDSELMLAAITNGDESNAAVSAALDALREENGDALLAAVFDVARTYKAAQDSRDMAEATKQLAAGSPIRRELTRAILAECHQIRAGESAIILIVDGDRWPQSERGCSPPDRDGEHLVSVGALWVKREASRLMLKRAPIVHRPAKRRRRSR